jgi:tRNA 2-thiocytidine biosynthesis protein TtcA
VRELSRKEKTEFNKLQKRLRRNVGNAIADYNMIEAGDRVMVCLSGGKDSYGMLDILVSLRHNAPIDFELVAVNLDQKQPGFPEQVLPDYLSALGIRYYILEKDTYSIVREVVPEGKTTCGLCSRLRRGSLYGFATDIGATKIALGHHRDDIVETLFLNMFFNGSLKAMPPKLLSDDKQNVVIRPLAYCKEKDLARFADYKAFPIIASTPGAPRRFSAAFGTWRPRNWQTATCSTSPACVSRRIGICTYPRSRWLIFSAG